jgi:hypothetical protein
MTRAFRSASRTIVSVGVRSRRSNVGVVRSSRSTDAHASLMLALEVPRSRIGRG